jgi:hypothetical protein
MTVKLTNAQKGDAGEYAAAAELAARGWMVDLPRRGAKDIDLDAHSAAGARTAGIQVKTRASGDFALGENLMALADADAASWVVLVTLAPAGERSHFFVVPGNHVTAGMLAYAGGRPDGGAGWTRKYFGQAEFAGYDEAWDLMDTPAWRAPWRMPA